jgi:trk system potassium uptake protein
MSKRLFANLGFLLQISGLLTIFPIIIGLYFNESSAVISLFLACVAFLGSGFLLNALCVRKDLDFKGSNFLFLAAFIVLPLIGALPYLYLDPFGSASVLDKFTNSIFESVSGFTTTGFSFIASPEALPYSVLIYRSITELMGGIGLIFLLLAFFQSKRSLNKLSNSVGIDNVNGDLKKTYLSVFALYTACIVAFIGIFYALGFTNLLTTGTYVVDTLTGGFSPSAVQFEQYLSLAPKICTLILMIFGALNFGIIYNFFTGKLRNAFSWETVLFFIIIALGTISVSVAGNLGVFDSFFHVVSMSSSVGYTYIPLQSLSDTTLSILIVLMLIGGCTFSMAGGIKVSRIITFFKSTIISVESMLVKEHAIAKVKKTETNGSYENLSASFSIMIFVGTLVLFAMIFTTIGISFTDALFEVGSALTTSGLSMGAITMAMPIGYKWLIIAAMTIGRVEILSLLIAAIALSRKLSDRFQS